MKKLLTIVLAALLLLKTTGSVSLAAGGAILGVTVSCVASVLYLLSCFQKGFRQLPESSDPALSGKSTAKQLLAIAVPITIGAAGLQLLTVLETGIYMDNILGLLQDGRYDNSVINALRQQVLTNYPGISLENLQNKLTFHL